MNVASLELCELSDRGTGAWSLTEFGYIVEQLRAVPTLKAGEAGHSDFVPAYDLGYLLRKLPHYDAEGWDLVLTYAGEEHIIAGYQDPEDTLAWHTKVSDAIPEDAAAKLAIELFKQGALKR